MYLQSKSTKELEMMLDDCEQEVNECQTTIVHPLLFQTIKYQPDKKANHMHQQTYPAKLIYLA
jgi:hypothetical protein